MGKIDGYGVSRRKFLHFAAIGTGVSLAAACTRGAPKAARAPSADASKVKLTVALATDVVVFDPQKLAGSKDYNVNANLYESLYQRDFSGTLVPALATGYEAKDAGRRYEFTLRKNVKFHNGDAFTARDVKFSFDRAVNPATKYAFAGQLGNVTAVEVLADDRVAFSLSTPDASFLPLVSWYLLVAPSEYLQRVGDDGFANQPVGTGPYRLTNRRANEIIELEAFADHWRAVPAVRNVAFRPVPEASSRVAMLRTGEADIAVNLPPILEKQIADTPGLRTLSAPTDGIASVVLDAVTKPNSPYADQRVRQAFNYAVDKQSIIDRLLAGHATPTYAPATSSMIGYDPSMKPYPYDPAKAKQLLADAGYGAGFEASISVPAGSYVQGEQVTQAVAGYLSDIGVKTSVVTLERQAWLARLRARDIYPMTFVVRGDSTFDPNGRLMNGVHSKAPYSFYFTPKLDAEILQGRAILDPKARAEFYRKLYGQLHEAASELFLYQEHAIFGLREGVDWKPAQGEGFTKMWEARVA